MAILALFVVIAAILAIVGSPLLGVVILAVGVVLFATDRRRCDTSGHCIARC